MPQSRCCTKSKGVSVSPELTKSLTVLQAHGLLAEEHECSKRRVLELPLAGRAGYPGTTLALRPLARRPSSL